MNENFLGHLTFLSLRYFDRFITRAQGFQESFRRGKNIGRADHVSWKFKTRGRTVHSSETFRPARGRPGIKVLI